MNTGDFEKIRCNVADVNEEPGWCKDEQVVYTEGDEHFCIFHAPKEHKGVPIEDFNKLIFNRLNTALENNEECDLFSTVFPGDINFRNINPACRLPSFDLTGAQFWGKAEFDFVKFPKGISFFGATFAQEARFFDAEFEGWADFQSVTFSEEASFISTNFLQSSNFNYAKFGEFAYFRSVKFGQNSVFCQTEFGKNAYFTDAIFKENADFSKAIFRDIADFSDADFRGISHFKETTFNGCVKLGVKFNKAYFLHNSFPGVASIYGIIIEDEIRFKDVNFSCVLFHGAEMERMHFEHCTWSESKSEGRIIILDETEIAKDGDGKEMKEVEEIYRILKQKYKEMGNEGMASLFHMSEKTMLTRRTHFKDKPFYWALLRSYKFSSGYGENPSQAFLVFLILLIASILGIWFAGLKGATNEPVTFFQALLTTIEFLTFQRETHYGLKTATGFAGVIRILSVILVYLQALLFIFALRNRLRR